MLVLFAAFFCLGVSHVKGLQKDAMEKMLLLEDFGNSLHAVYRSALLNKNWSIPLNDQKLPASFGSQCLVALNKIKNDDKKLFKYLDAAGKPRSGILRGNSAWIGSYSECQAISDGKYCLSKLGLINGTFTIPWGACFPSVCNETEIYFAMKLFIIPKVETKTGVKVTYSGSMCPGGPSYDSGVIGTLVFFGFLLLFCFVGTVMDLVIEEHKEVMAVEELQENEISDSMSAQIDDAQHNMKNLPVDDEDHALLLPGTTSSLPQLFSSNFPGIFLSTLKFFRDFFLCFSLVRNTEKIFKTDVSSVAITSVNGIRVISMSWVILGHVFWVFSLSFLTDNKLGIVEDSQRLSRMPVINAFFSVDTFFFLSGLLVAYTCFRKLEENGGVSKFNWFLFYFHRFWRLTPAYMVVILFSINVKRFLASGPVWLFLSNDKQCEEYWWTNLLYINNFYPKSLKDECFGVSWYLANDMQFFIITPLLLILMYKLRWRGIIGPVSLISASVLVTAFIIGYWDLNPLGNVDMGQLPPEQVKKRAEFEDYVYIKPYCRVQPYLVGFILGYYFHQRSKRYYNRERQLVAYWLVTVIGWLCAAGVAMWLVYGPHKFIIKGAKEWLLVARAVYGGTKTLLWGLVLSWVTYACHFGGGGFVKKFLSAKFWIPLSRLTYSTYLIHIIVLSVLFAGTQETIHYDIYTATYYFLAALVLSYAAAYVLAVTVEYPCENFEYLVLKTIRGSTQ